MHEKLKSDIKALIKRHRLKVREIYWDTCTDEGCDIRFRLKKGSQFVEIDLDDLLSDVMGQRVTVRPR